MELNELKRLDSNFNLLIATAISVVIMLFAIFTAREFVFPDITEGDESLEFIDFDQINPRQRTAKKEISTEDGEVSEDSEATGSSDNQSFTDLDLHPNATMPSLVGRLKIDPPTAAKENDVSATIYLHLYLSNKGQIKKIQIFRIRLSKAVTEGLKVKIIDQIKSRTLAALRGRRYKPAIMEGRAIASKSLQEIELTYR